jgi:hypothetical protein
MNNQLAQMIFEKWMAQKHPMYYYVMGSIFWFSVLGIIFSIASIWLLPTLWWKIGISVIGFFFLTKLVATVFMNMYVEEFKSGKNKLVM